MKIKEVREKDDAALLEELNGKFKNLHTLRTQKVTDKLSSPALIRHDRRDIARIKTVLRERQLKAAK